MSEQTVIGISIEDLLNRLRKREWLIPQFQRDFVWSTGQVTELVQSILLGRPIGMATIWEQSDEATLELEAITLRDKGFGGEQTLLKFHDTDQNPKKVFAVLDGKQRCTAAAMAFGGFHTHDNRLKFSGRYFLDVKQKDTRNQVVYYKEKDVQQKGYNKDNTCIGNGLFPLSSSQGKETMLGQWMRYLQAINDPSNYSDGNLPPKDELERRDLVLKKAFDGIIKTRLGVYVVPESYDLAEVCEIFATLNLTGTDVSTVDLIHSWLYSDTASDAKQIHLREWIDDLGDKDGARGWASAKVGDRPELVAQMVTATYVALDQKPKPRPVKKVVTEEHHAINSIKADDLLRTPTAHWKTLIANEDRLATFLGDFQMTMAGGYFPWTSCPYPVSATTYIALRFHMHFDIAESHPWTRDDLDALYKAFFWMNALTSRYDQGFLTQLGTDIKDIKDMLRTRQKFESASQWATEMQPRLQDIIKKPLPSEDELIDAVTDKIAPGAFGKALLLPMTASARRDLLDENIKLSYPECVVEMHHIFPRDWCANNKVGKLSQLLDEEKAGRDWVNSAANLMPLSRASNNAWKKKIPGQILVDKGIDYGPSEVLLKAAFIDRDCFNFLLDGEKHIEEFWVRRASLIAKDLSKRMQIKI